MSEQWKPGTDDQVLGRELRDTLVRHAEDGAGGATDLSAVRGRARRIRRTRRAAVAGGVAAAVAVVAPLAALGAGALRADGPPPQVSEQRKQSDVRIPYLRGSALVLPDGRVRELPQGFQEGAVQGTDLYGVYGTEETGGNRLVVVHADGSAEDFVDIGSNLASNDDGSVLAWSEENGDLVLHSADGEFGIDAPRYFLPHGVVGDAGCAADGTCLVFGDLPDQGALVGWQLGYTLPPKTLSLIDVTADGWVAREVRRTPSGPCASVYDPSLRADTLKTCDRSLDEFSGDGRYISASHRDYDLGIDKLDVAMLDVQTGDPVATFIPTQGQTIADSTWEDDEHLLVQVHGEDGWSVVRMGTDGSQDAVLGPFDNGSDTIPGYTLLDQTV